MRALLTGLMVLVASVALAQTAQPTSYTFRVRDAQGVLVGPPLTVQATQVLCDLAPAVGFTNVNPDRWRWVDPARPTRECELPDAARLAALPDGDYSGTITANADLPSAETTPIPFVRRRPQTPGVPTGGKVINSVSQGQ